MRSLPSSARGRTGTACTAWATPANPAFNHEGATILAYLPSGNPLTLEFIVYGLSAAVMMASVILWFSCYNAVMTSDKFVYLFGRVIPALVWLAFCGVYIACGGLYWRYFATIKGVAAGAFPASFQAVYLALGLTPVLLNVQADRAWARLHREPKPELPAVPGSAGCLRRLGRPARGMRRPWRGWRGRHMGRRGNSGRFPGRPVGGIPPDLFPDWLDFYRGDNAALIRKYGSLENARALPLQTRTKPPACWTGSGIQRRASCWIPGI